MTKFRDTDYLHASARVRVIEQGLLGADALKKMAEARTMDEAWKIANDAAIGAGEPFEQYEDALTASVEEAYRLAGELLHEDGVLSLFRLRYDAHNLKTLVKGAKAGPRAELLSNLGNLSAERVTEQFQQRRFGPEIPEGMAAAAAEAAGKLLKNGDPQAADIAIDKAWLDALAAGAGEYDCPFIARWARTQIDVANIRTLFRVKRMGRDKELLLDALAQGGSIEPKELAAVLSKDWDEVFALVLKAPCSKVMAPAFEDVKNGKTLSRFERLCDNASVTVLRSAHYVPFGIEPVLAWLLAKESEAQAARIVLACKKAGLAPADIIERLRDSYAQ